MPTPSGQISLGDINVELGLTATAQISMNDTVVRTLAGVVSGEISLQNLQNKSNTFSFNLTSGSNLNLRTQAVLAGWTGTSLVIATIPAGNTISSTSTGASALTVDGSFPNGVQLVNNGTIVGAGGGGGQGALNGGRNATAGGGGGTGLTASVAVSVTNNGTIAGGGGGGGGGGVQSYTIGSGKSATTGYSGGGGGGGGAGINAGGGGVGGNNGSAGSATAGGAGGASTGVSSTPGGAGGARGTAGSAGTGGNIKGAGGGGAAGNAVTGSSNITWIATGTRLGPVV